MTKIMTILIMFITILYLSGLVNSLQKRSVSITALNLVKDKQVPNVNSNNKQIVIDKNYNVAIGFGVLTAAVLAQHNVFLGLPLSAITALLAVQTGRVKFVFDKEAMEVFVSKNENGKEKFMSRENFAVGGRNRWKYNNFLKWSFIPSKDFPVFMYFTESQTDPSKPGGQFHLFPVIMNGKQLYDQLILRVEK